METQNCRPFVVTSEPDSPGLGHGALPCPSRENPGNDAAAKSKVWQALSLKRKLNFIAPTLAGLPALIKDNVSRGLRASYEYSRRQRLPTVVAREVQMAEQIKTNRPYPIQLKLRDGHSAVIRVMGPDDLDRIIDFARSLPAD